MNVLVFIGAMLLSATAFSQTATQTNNRVSGAELVQEVTATDTLKVGEPFTMTLVLTHPLDTEIVLPDEIGTSRIQLIEKSASTEPHESDQRSTLRLTFASFRPGATTLPPFDVTIYGRDGETETVKSAPVPLKVIDGIGDTLDPSFKPPRPPVEIWVEDLTLAWVGGIGFGALLFGALGFFVWSRRETIVIPPPPRAPHEIALEKLSAIAAAEMMERDEYMLFYVRVSEAIREYMGNVHKFPGTELTTTEILAELKPKFFPRGISHDDIGDFLRETDLVKFGGIKPSTEEADRILRRAFTIVELTRMPTAGLPKPEESESDRDVDDEPLEPISPWAPPEEEE